MLAADHISMSDSILSEVTNTELGAVFNPISPLSDVGTAIPYGLASSTAVLGVDLVAISFDATTDHVLLGKTAVSFTLQNQGMLVANNFEVDILYSEDAQLGNDDDIVVGTFTISAIAPGDTLIRTVDVQLPVDLLNDRAQADDLPGQGSGYVSTSANFLGIQIDPENAIAESNEENNINETKGRGVDDVTYFPWDIDGNGVVTPTDAIFAINRLGETVTAANAKADFDGNGVITPTDAISAINRLGYSINPEVTTPLINAIFSRDTGSSATDNITSDATVEGVIADYTEVATFQAKVEGARNSAFIDITDRLEADGRFMLTQSQLNDIVGEPLPDGPQTLILQTLDDTDTVSSRFELSFQLDTQGPIFETAPPTGTLIETFSSFDIAFSEAIDDIAFDETSYTLQTETGRAIEIASVTRLSETSIRINLESELPNGRYEFEIAPTLADLAGNTINAENTASQFSVFEATTFWVGGSGFWDDATNWSTGKVPSPDDIALIDVPEDAVITYRSGNSSILGLASKEKIVVSGGSLTFLGNTQLNNDVVISNGTLTFREETIIEGDLAIQGGTNILNGDITVNGDIDWTSGGTLTINGSSGLTNTGTLTISDSLSKTFSGILNNEGTVIHDANRAIFFKDGTINNFSGAIYELRNGVLDFNQGVNNINNQGTFRNVGTGTNIVDVAFNNAGGTIDVQSGTLNFSRGGRSQGGTYTLADNGLLRLTGGTHVYSGTHSASGQGQVQVTVGGLLTTKVDETAIFRATNGAAFALAGGTLEQEGTQRFINGFNILGGGIIEGSGTIELEGDSGWTSGGTLTINNRNGLTNTGALTISDSLSKTFSGILNNEGTVIHDANRAIFFRDGTINNLSGAIYELRNGVLDFNQGVNNINNQGIFRNVGAGTNIVDVAFNNAGGTIDVRGGTLNFSRGGRSQSGTYTLANNGLLRLSGGTHIYGGTHSASGQGQVQVTVGGLLTTKVDETAIFRATNGAAFALAGGTLGQEGTQRFLNGFNILGGGTIEGSGTIELEGDSDWTSGGTLTINNNNGLTNTGTLTISDSLSKTFSGILNNEGTVIHDANRAIFFKDGTINNFSGAIYELRNGVLDFNQGVNNINNQGTFRNVGTGTNIVDVAFNNAGGTVDVQGGTLNFSRAFNQINGTTKLSGGSINSSNPLNIQGGLLTGFGNLNADIINSGILKPGSSIGLLTINGDYTQTSEGTIDIEIGGVAPISQFDRLIIKGTASFNGILDINLTNGFSPTDDDSFEVFNFNSKFGDFKAARGLEIGNGLIFMLIYETDRLILLPM